MPNRVRYSNSSFMSPSPSLASLFWDSFGSWRSRSIRSRPPASSHGICEGREEHQPLPQGRGVSWGRALVVLPNTDEQTYLPSTDLYGAEPQQCQHGEEVQERSSRSDAVRAWSWGHNSISCTSAETVCIPTLQSAKLPKNLKPQDNYFGFDLWPESSIGTLKAPSLRDLTSSDHQTRPPEENTVHS
uniref:Uncharacterized protein n=1 Tax=Bubo bubo TaxID=30461 RepID=A0A8C0FP84_BUBBB